METISTFQHTIYTNSISSNYLLNGIIFLKLSSNFLHSSLSLFFPFLSSPYCLIYPSRDHSCHISLHVTYLLTSHLSMKRAGQVKKRVSTLETRISKNVFLFLLVKCFYTTPFGLNFRWLYCPRCFSFSFSVFHLYISFVP